MPIHPGKPVKDSGATKEATKSIRLEGLTPRQSKFVREYVTDYDGYQAYRRAGYKAKSKTSASTMVQKLLRNKTIQHWITILTEEYKKNLSVTKERVVEELASIGFAKMTDFVEWNNNSLVFKDSAELTNEQAAVVGKIKRRITKEGNHMELDFHSKMEALRLLAKHTGVDSVVPGAPEEFAAKMIAASESMHQTIPNNNTKTIEHIKFKLESLNQMFSTMGNHESVIAIKTILQEQIQSLENELRKAEENNGKTT